MTREKAIEVIKEVRFDINTKINGTTRFSQALEIAIRALEQEPILDKIRAEIDKIYKREGNSVDCLNALNELKWFIDKYKVESESQESEKT